MHYHFGGRDGLLDALVARHHDAIDAERHAALSELDATPQVADLVAIIVRPLISRLDSAGGRAFLRVLADRFVGTGEVGQGLAPSMGDVIERLVDLVPDAPADVRAERARLTTSMINVRLGQAAATPEHHDHDLLRDTLIAAVTAVLTSSP